MLDTDYQIEYNVSLFTDYDINLFRAGKHFELYNLMGSRLLNHQGQKGVYFALWAPNARSVSVIGEFNRWQPAAHPLKKRTDESGIWEGFIPSLQAGMLYKYHIQSLYNDFKVDKGDPFAYYWEKAPNTASLIWDIDYSWHDREWLRKRVTQNPVYLPVSIYELNCGSWRRLPEEGNRPLTYRELTPALIEYIKEMGFTHVEFMPVMEHPFLGSWGYQLTGYYAPTSRYGSPQDFMYLIDSLHQAEIGVVLDWVPSHFPRDGHGLVYFDGTCLYEHADPRKGYHPDWTSYIFNYGRNEIRCFLISNVLFWLDKYHVDAIRVDAVASMLYLDYSRKEGEWIPNEYGNHDNLEAISFLQEMNDYVKRRFPDVQMIAEESTAWPNLTKPVSQGGLGFSMKWNMGWMHDTLSYFTKHIDERICYQDKLTHNIMYAFSENFILPFSHDEVVHCKGSLLNKMPGDYNQKFANLRILLGFMFMHPGKKLLFMGDELAEWDEWNYEGSLHWNLLDYPIHRGLQRWVADLNALYRAEPALYTSDFNPIGFEWVDFKEWRINVISFLRRDLAHKEVLLAVINFSAQPCLAYRLGVPRAGYWQELLNSAADTYGGPGVESSGGLYTENVYSHYHDNSLLLDIPALSIMIFKHRNSKESVNPVNHSK